MTKDKIIIAALRLFLLNGYKNVSLVDVASEVGITKGGIYHYFDSKEVLLHAAVHHLFERFEAKYVMLFGGTKNLLETLHAVMIDREMEVYIEQLLAIKQGGYRDNHASLALEVMDSFPGFQERLGHSHLQLLQAIEEKVKTAQEKGEIKGELDAYTLAIIILSIMSGQNVLGADFQTVDIRQKVLDSLWMLIRV
ncbi:MAG: TetR/AcrR family transcriptional regulator [Negativicutes bacterium]|nr:TetR/AcrR family transcriptional regulator [Negativicutes bacterium]